jgi:hypothetical protein
VGILVFAPDDLAVGEHVGGLPRADAWSRPFGSEAGPRFGAPRACLANTIGASQIGLHGALRESLDGFFPLVRGQLQRMAKSHATGLCSLAAVVGTTKTVGWLSGGRA